MPEKILKKLNSYIMPQWKVCFFAAFIAGLFAHLYKITSWLPNWDSLVFRYDPQNMVGLGRWFLPVVTSLTSFYDLPLLNGIMAITFHALGAVVICRILNVQRKITAALIGALIVTFPTVTSVMMYNYVSDGYGFAFFLSVLSAFYMTKEKPEYLLASALIALSTGIYQAYITVSIMLVLLKLIDESVYEHVPFGTILKRAVRMLLSGVLGVFLYAVILKAALAFSSAQLLDYQGINSAASLSGIDLAGSLYTIKETFLNFFFDFSHGLNIFVSLNIFIFIFTVIYNVWWAIKTKLYKKTVNFLMIALLAVMLLFGAGILAFVNAGVDYHNLMLMGYSVFYLFFLIIYERGNTPSPKKCWIVLVVSLILIANQVVIANVSYHKAQMAYEKSYGTLIRIADRIEETEGTQACKKILVIGALSESEAYSVNLPPDITGITDGYILRADDETVSQSVLTSALNDYCGKDYSFIAGEDKKEFLKKEEIKAMDIWPHSGSVAVIDDTIVIKLSAEGEN